MLRMFALIAVMMLTASLAGAQQPQQTKLNTPGGLLSAGTPGVEVGTTGTTYGTPGAAPAPSMPGGSIPMGAATQQDNPRPAGTINYNNSVGLPSDR